MVLEHACLIESLHLFYFISKYKIEENVTMYYSVFGAAAIVLFCFFSLENRIVA